MSTRVCGCDDEVGWVSEECRKLGWCRTLQDALFGEPDPSQAVRASELQAADLRETVEAVEQEQACEACGRIWRHQRATGHGERTQRYGAEWWHRSCRRKTGEPG